MWARLGVHMHLSGTVERMFAVRIGRTRDNATPEWPLLAPFRRNLGR